MPLLLAQLAISVALADVCGGLLETFMPATKAKADTTVPVRRCRQSAAQIGAAQPNAKGAGAAKALPPPSMTPPPSAKGAKTAAEFLAKAVDGKTPPSWSPSWKHDIGPLGGTGLAAAALAPDQSLLAVVERSGPPPSQWRIIMLETSGWKTLWIASCGQLVEFRKLAFASGGLWLCWLGETPEKPLSPAMPVFGILPIKHPEQVSSSPVPPVADFAVEERHALLLRMNGAVARVDLGDMRQVSSAKYDFGGAAPGALAVAADGSVLAAATGKVLFVLPGGKLGRSLPIPVDAAPVSAWPIDGRRWFLRLANGEAYLLPELAEPIRLSKTADASFFVDAAAGRFGFSSMLNNSIDVRESVTGAQLNVIVPEKIKPKTNASLLLVEPLRGTKGSEEVFLVVDAGGHFFKLFRKGKRWQKEMLLAPGQAPR